MNFDCYYYNVDWNFESVLSCDYFAVAYSDKDDRILFMFRIAENLNIDEYGGYTLSKSFDFFLKNTLNFLHLPCDIQKEIYEKCIYSRSYENKGWYYLASQIIKNDRAKEIYDYCNPYYQWVNTKQ